MAAIGSISATVGIGHLHLSRRIEAGVTAPVRPFGHLRLAGGVPMRYTNRRMTHRLAAIGVLLVALVAAPVTAFAGPDTEPFLQRLLDTRAFTLGVSEPSFWDLG